MWSGYENAATGFPFMIRGGHVTSKDTLPTCAWNFDNNAHNQDATA